MRAVPFRARRIRQRKYPACAKRGDGSLLFPALIPLIVNALLSGKGACHGIHFAASIPSSECGGVGGGACLPGSPAPPAPARPETPTPADPVLGRRPYPALL